MMKLRINPFVVKDLQDIRSFIEEDNFKKAEEIVTKIIGIIEELQSFPYMGTSLSKRVSFKTDYRYVIWKNYVVLYKIKNDAVEIYRVLNQLQDITKVFIK